MAVPSTESLLEVLRRVIQAEFQISPEAVDPGTHLIDDLELDSVDAVTLSTRLEEETGLSLDGDDLRAMSTVASLIEVVSARLGEREGRTP